MIGFGDEAVFLGGCPVIKPHDGIYVEGQRVIALAGAGTLGDRYSDEGWFYGIMLGAPIVGAVIGAKMSKKHRIAGGAAGFAAGSIGGFLTLATLQALLK